MQTSLTLKKEETSREDKNIKLDPPIFIVGSGRSGTALLLQALSKHHNIYGIREEIHFFVDYKTKGHKRLDKFESRKDIEDLTLTILALIFYGIECMPILVRGENYPHNVLEVFNEVKQVDGFKNLKDRFDVFDFCVNYLTLKEGKKRWLEKTPPNIRRVDSILEKYPKAQFIETYRDPRAVYLSWKKAEIDFFKQSDIFECISYWNKAAFCGERFFKLIPNQFYRLQYEKLVNSPEDELKKLCIFLNEDFDPNVLNVEVVNNFFSDIEGQKGFSKVPVDRWKTLLRDEEKLFIDIATKKYRKKLDYKDSYVKLTPFVFLSLIIFSLKAFFKASKRPAFFNNCVNRLISALRCRSYSIRKVLWLIRRKQVISSYLKSNAVKKLQLGANGNVLQEWLNSDIAPTAKDVIFLDSSNPFPFEDNVFDYVFSEHHIEHLLYEEGSSMLKECWRVLKPGGKIRIATPDLEVFLNLYKKEKTEIQERYIHFVADYLMDYIGFKEEKDVFVINNIFYNFGHRFIYDKRTLRNSLRKSGFTEPHYFPVGKSEDEALRNIESHHKSYQSLGYVGGEDLNEFETMVLEASKPL